MFTFKNGKTRSNASIIKEHLESLDKIANPIHEDLIDLYPQQNKEENFYLESMNKIQESRNARDRRISFRENVTNELLFHAMYDGIIAPVMESAMSNTHEKTLAQNTISDFIQQEGAEELIEKFKYKNFYLAEFAQLIDQYTDIICEEADDKIREGLSEKDAYTIENQKIDDFILNAQDVVPNDITKCIQDRVEDSINDFIDDNKKNKFEIKKIYDKAKEKISQADGDPDVQQEALNTARRKERAITECDTNVFGSMVRIMVESVYKIAPLKEAYSKSNSDRIDYTKVVGDTRTIYTFMEAMNTLGIIEADETYVKDTINNLKNSMDDTVTTQDHDTPDGEKTMPKEEDQDPGDDNDNDPSNDQDQPSIHDDDDKKDDHDDDDDEKDHDEDDDDDEDHHDHKKHHHHHDDDDDEDDDD